jgi:cysteinyl-tRNA synthetase
LLADLKAVESSEINESSQDFIAPLLDDLNTPGLLANLNKMINEFKTISDKDLPEFKSKLLLAADLIGICQEDYLDWFDNGKVDIDASKVDALILERLNAKKNKDFDKADAIRQQLLEMSIEIKDTESGTDWTVKV